MARLVMPGAEAVCGGGSRRVVAAGAVLLAVAILAVGIGAATAQVNSTLTGGGANGGSQWSLFNIAGTSNGLPAGGSCLFSALGPGLGISDAQLGIPPVQSDAFDVGLTVWVNDAIFVDPNFTPTGGQSYSAGPVTMAGLDVSVQYFAASTSATMRTLVTLRHPSPTGGPITVTVKWVTNNGSDSGTVVRGTSSGDTLFDTGDRWVVTSDGFDSDPVNTHVLFGPGTPAVTPASVSQTVFNCAGIEGILAAYDVTVPPGATRALLFFNQLNTTRTVALANATAFDSNTLPGDLLSGLTPTQLGEVVNWAFTPTLTVIKTGTGSGRVTSSPPGIDCGSDCSEAFNGATVTLTAVADPGSQFAGFGGDPDCADGTVTVDVSRTCTATFTVTLTVTTVGNGTVTSTPAGIACGTDCSEVYLSPAVVTLTAAPAAGSVFTGFGGAPDCVDGVVTMRADTACTATFAAVPPPPPPQVVGVVSAGVGGQAANGDSVNPVVSADGRFIAFESAATNLVTGACAIPGVRQIFRRDRVTGATICVSVAGGAPAGVAGAVTAIVGGDAASSLPAVSGDGNVIAFQSRATTLDPACADGRSHVLVRNVAAGTTTCASVGPAGAGDGDSGAPALSADGRVLAFESVAANLAAGCGNGQSQVLVRDLVAGATTCASVGPAGAGDGPSAAPALSADGNLVAFQSAARTLPAPCTTGVTQIFVRDRAAGTTTCVSVGADGAAGDAASGGPALSADGNLVAFESAARNLASPCTTPVTQVFVRNRPAGTTVCVSVGADGLPGSEPSTDAAISGNGLIVAFSTAAPNVIAAAGGSGGAPGPVPAATEATEGLGPGVVAQSTSLAQMMTRNIATSVVQLMSQGPSGPGNGGSTKPSMSFDGTVTVYQTAATNLVSGDTNQASDILFATQEVPPRAGQVTVIAPADGTQFALGAPTAVTFAWTPLPGVARYGFEFTGANRQFDNPNGTGPDPVNGFGGTGGGFAVDRTSFPAVLDASFPQGAYQVRVIGLSTAGPIGTFSNAVTLILGPGALSGAPNRVTVTAPAEGAVLSRGQPATFAWSTLGGVTQYFFEVSGPDRPFANPNGVGPDPGAIGGFAVVATNLTAVIPGTIAQGAYRVRVIGLSPTGQFVGTFSDAVRVVVQ